MRDYLILYIVACWKQLRVQNRIKAEIIAGTAKLGPKNSLSLPCISPWMSQFSLHFTFIFQSACSFLHIILQDRVFMEHLMYGNCFSLFYKIESPSDPADVLRNLESICTFSLCTAHLLNSCDGLVQLPHRQLQFCHRPYGLPPLQIAVFAQGIDLETVKRMRPHCLTGD